MGKFKEMAIEMEEQLNENQTQPTTEEEAAAQQEAYYYYVIQEFFAICKIFGTHKVMEDLASFKQSLEIKEDKPRIQLL